MLCFPLSHRPGNNKLLFCYYDYYIWYILCIIIIYIVCSNDHSGAISISQALMVNQTLLELHMGYNKIGDDGITAIAGSLSNSNITLLNVMECGIGLVGVTSLAAALSSNKNIRKLWLHNNPISLDGAHLIMKSAVNNGVCENVSISSEYWDEEIKRMMTILNDRRRQNVRIYTLLFNYYCYGYRGMIKNSVKMKIVLKRSH